MTAGGAVNALDRYQATIDRLGYGRWAMERREDGTFIGYVGMMPIAAGHAADYIAGPGVEIGWRMILAAWRAGLATEGAAAALSDGFERWGSRRLSPIRRRPTFDRAR